MTKTREELFENALKKFKKGKCVGKIGNLINCVDVSAIQLQSFGRLSCCIVGHCALRKLVTHFDHLSLRPTRSDLCLLQQGGGAVFDPVKLLPYIPAVPNLFCCYPPKRDGRDDRRVVKTPTRRSEGSGFIPR